MKRERVSWVVFLGLLCVISFNTAWFVLSFPRFASGDIVSLAFAESLPDGGELKYARPLALPPTPTFLDQITADGIYVSHEWPAPRLLFMHDAYDERPVASLTKLMTALTLLEYAPNWESVVTISQADMRGGAKSRLAVGDQITVADLWADMLIGSDNDGTAALVRHVAGSEDEFVEKMNNRAKRFGLQQTMFVEPTGLSGQNRSTAKEFAMIARMALRDDHIRKTVSSDKVSIEVSGRTIQINSTDQYIRYHKDVLTEGWRYRAGKTGFTNSAGYTAAVLGTDKNGRETLVVVLGSNSKVDRSLDISALQSWAAGL